MRIEVAGIPAPQGSKRHVGGGRMVEQSRAVGPWREAVRAETQRVADGIPPFTWGIGVELRFRLPRPKSLPARYTVPVRRPDLDKLCRAVLDGLAAGGAITDDSLVVYLLATKEFATPTEPPGCVIHIWSEQ
jgi:crossover junction endodeoxyribonuclease RusA